jgi:hypothetical protein
VIMHCVSLLQELKPASKPGSRRGSFNPANKDDGGGDAEWNWDKESTPLQPRPGGPEGQPKFIDKPCDKWSGTEKDKMFCMLEVFGDPPPEVSFFKGFKDLSSDPRFKVWTDGETGQGILGIESLKQEDEGAYRCCLNGGEENGGVEHEFSIYVTVAGGMDFRAMLAKKKKPAKKVVEKFEWIEEPPNRSIKQGTVDEVTFACKLSHKGKKAKWYLRNQECYKGKKYTMTTDEDLFTLTIKNPETGDAGRYTCVVRECNDLTCKVQLEVERKFVFSTYRYLHIFF